MPADRRPGSSEAAATTRFLADECGARDADAWVVGYLDRCGRRCGHHQLTRMSVDLTRQAQSCSG